MKPCNHDSYTDGCRICHLAASDARYQRLWGILKTTDSSTPSMLCARLGQQKGLVDCPSCGGHVQVKTFACPVHQDCTINKPVAGYQCCRKCPDWTDNLEGDEVGRVRIAVGVTTVPERKELLARTLTSLKAAGFASPRVFVDGGDGTDDFYTRLELPVTDRFPKVGAVGNWALALWELMIREPVSSHYAIFQDDLIACRGIRTYLEQLRLPAKGYFNLYEWPNNAEIAKQHNHQGFYRPVGNRKRGLGAVGLVLPRDAAVALLCSPTFVTKPLSVQLPTTNLDGCIVEALERAGHPEHVHHPSLLQHMGEVSSIGRPRHPSSPTFVGENFDATSLLSKT